MAEARDRAEGLDLGSIFLGPKGENAEVFERLLLEAFRDHVFWRRNFHPEDGLLVPSTAHYSWEKICRSLGIGAAQLVHVPVDHHFRMDPEALRQTLHGLAARRQPVIACVSVIGTTEEGTVDRFDQIAEVREQVGRESGVAFHLHADAAWGGYAASILYGADGQRPPDRPDRVRCADVTSPTRCWGLAAVSRSSAAAPRPQHRLLRHRPPIPPYARSDQRILPPHLPGDERRRSAPRAGSRLFLTKTVLRAGEYGRSALPIVTGLGFNEDDYRRAGGVSVIRSTVMDPFLANPRGRTDHIGGFVRTLRMVMEDSLVADDD